MKPLEILMTILTKKGLIYEANNLNVNIPYEDSIIHISVDHMTLKVEKDEKGE